MSDRMDMFEVMAGLGSEQVQVLIRTCAGAHVVMAEERVEMPERFGAWRRRGHKPERYMFDATPEGHALGRAVLGLYNEAQEAWAKYRESEGIGCPPRVFRDGYATGFRAALMAQSTEAPKEGTDAA